MPNLLQRLAENRVVEGSFWNFLKAVIQVGLNHWHPLRDRGDHFTMIELDPLDGTVEFVA